MTRPDHERLILKRSHLLHLYPGSLPIILGRQKMSPGSDLPFLADIPPVPSQDIASKTKTSLCLRRFYPTVTATIAASKTRRDLNNNLANEVWELFSHIVRKRVWLLGCVPLWSMPTHCAAQVHNSNTALNSTGRVAAALSAALQHFCQHWIHSELWIIWGLFKTTL